MIKGGLLSIQAEKMCWNKTDVTSIDFILRDFLSWWHDLLADPLSSLSWAGIVELESRLFKLAAVRVIPSDDEPAGLNAAQVADQTTLCTYSAWLVEWQVGFW